jgi:hypothetical protein
MVDTTLKNYYRIESRVADKYLGIQELNKILEEMSALLKLIQEKRQNL